jgi:hypothetical protein
MRLPEKRIQQPFFTAAALGLALVLAVAVAAAAIRLGIGVGGLRVVHRVAASLELVVAVWLGWLAWRARAARPDLFAAALVALGLTALLSIVGIFGGRQPPPAAAAANLLGGFALAAAFAWILGKKVPGTFSGKRFLTPFILVVALQVALGAWLAIVERFGAVLPAHAMLALVLAAGLGWAGGKALGVAATAVVLAGFTALHYEYSAMAALVHAAAAALLVASSAYALARSA